MAVRILEGVANLASAYDCSSLCSLRDMTLFVISKTVFRKHKFDVFFFQFFVEFPNPLVGRWSINLGSCESRLKIRLFKSV